MPRPTLEPGAVVRFHFSTHPPLEGVLRWTPAATGDSWIIDGPTPYYIQQFDFMEVLQGAESIRRGEV